MSNNERFCVGFLCFYKASFLATMFTLLGLGYLGGCGGGDDGTNCEMTENCGLDAGTTTPDTHKDACADYRWMAEKPWDCYDEGNVNFVCDPLELRGGTNAYSTCSIVCGKNFDMLVSRDGLKIHKTPPPAKIDFYDGGQEFHCAQRP
jgi:hypothetical protein